MRTMTARVKNAERMMTHAEAVEKGIELVFADGCRGVIPFSVLPEVGKLSNLDGIELPNPYQVNLRRSDGEVVELPWDFTRNYCDPSYRPRVEALAIAGNQSLGSRIRRLREAAGLTQSQIAGAAGIGRVTQVRIENGDQSPRYETLVALARALKQPLAQLLTDVAA